MSTLYQKKPLLILALKPYEVVDGSIRIASKGALPPNQVDFSTWCEANQDDLQNARRSNPFWRENNIELFEGSEIKLYHFLRRLSELGYEKESDVISFGQFSHQGNVVCVWPINSTQPFQIQFDGNVVEHIGDIEQEAQDPLYRKFAQTQDTFSPSPGEYVVHIDHGIGKYMGLVEQDGTLFHRIQYAKGDTLSVPQLVEEKLSNYVGFERPIVHRLGGGIWFTTKKRAKEDIYAFAKQLLELYAKRSVSNRPAYSLDAELMQEFESKFEFELTEDQVKAWDEIRADLTSTKPMDRLLCGDVGFGKTEVAMRAIATAVCTGKQVALIVPTTPLAWQHFKTLRGRFSSLPVNIELFSRVVNPKDIKRQIEELKEGTIDIAVGTHRLLSKDVKFQKLGLIVIDEEQKFGVKQKEHVFDAHPGVDFLTISATPIPRTLHLSMAGVRDISLILTPPHDRRSIETHVGEFKDASAYVAVQKELERGGQVYWLHNFVQTIYTRLRKLQKAFPNHSVGVIHGQMPEKHIVETLRAFEKREIDILIATSIIENGLDFPEANTLIVEDATRLGLAQAHQIRGRIGRSSTQAEAWFYYKKRSLTELGEERLDTLKILSGLGDGYNIAARDLEMRGAGNILGKEQSGTINKVGLNLYYQMLTQAVEELKK